MSLFGDPHLGDLAAALVDGELDHDARDRAFAHLAHCSGCRAEVDAQRRLKRRLAGLNDPAVDDALAQRLRSIATGDVVAASDRLRARRRPGATAPPGRPRRTRMPSARPRRVRVALAGGVALVVVGVGAVLAGGDTGDGRPVSPPVDRFVVEHVATSGELPLTDPAAGAATVTFASVGMP